MATRSVSLVCLTWLLVLSGCRAREESSLLEKAERHFKYAEFDAAIALCDRSIDQQPANDSAWLLRGRCFVETRKPERAIEDYTQAIRLQTDRKAIGPEVYYYRAIAYKLAGEPELADQDQREARRLDPAAEKARAMIGTELDGSYVFGQTFDKRESEDSAESNTAGSDDESDVSGPLDTTSDPLDSVIDPLAGLELPTSDIQPKSNDETQTRLDSSSRRRESATELPSRLGMRPLRIAGTEGLLRERIVLNPKLRIDSPRTLATGDQNAREGTGVSAQLSGDRSTESESSQTEDGTSDSGDSETRNGTADADQPTEQSEPESEEPTEPDEESSPRPRVPSGILWQPYSTGSGLPQTGYPYDSYRELSTPTAGYPQRPYELPRTGISSTSPRQTTGSPSFRPPPLPSGMPFGTPMLGPIPIPGSQRLLQSGRRPGVAGLPGTSATAKPAAAAQPVTGPAVAGPAGTGRAGATAGQQSPGQGQPQSRAASTRGPEWQNRIPFPQPDPPTTGTLYGFDN